MAQKEDSNSMRIKDPDVNRETTEIPFDLSTKYQLTNYTLKIKCVDKSLLSYYLNNQRFNPGDSGLDLYCPNDIEIRCGETKFIDLGIQCEMIEKYKLYSEIFTSNISYYLYPRSSLSKTPLILANHVGIIDAGYRGNIIAAVKYLPTIDDFEKIFSGKKANVYHIEAGTRLFQICHPSLKPFSYDVVDELSDSQRGSGGFGSTGV